MRCLPQFATLPIMDASKELSLKPAPQERQPGKTQTHEAGQAKDGATARFLYLQRTLGNRRVIELLRTKRLSMQGQFIGLQAKLTVGAADDPYEREADQTAQHVLAMPDSAIQRSPLTDGKQDEQGSRKSSEFVRLRAVQPQRESFEPGDEFESRLNERKGIGTPLPDHVRSYMEPRFGVDFSHVRVHADQPASHLNREVGAQAFTHGSEIFYGSGRGPGNLELTAHELTHVVQQTGGLSGRKLDRKCKTCPISAATSGIIQRDPPEGSSPPPDPGTAIVPSSLTLDNLIRATPPGFIDPVLDRAYQSYRSDEKSPSAPREWALHQTSGAPRARLVQLLGPDYAVGQRGGASRPPVNVLDANRPPGYSDARLAQNLQALGQNLPNAPGMRNLLQTPIPGGMMNSGNYANLQGMIGEALARQPLESALEQIRQKEPDAQLFLNVRARLLQKTKGASGAEVLTPGDPVQFSDGIIGAIRGRTLVIFRVAEVKSGAGGGVQVAEQIFRWIEAHATVGFVLELPGVSQSFEYSDARRQVINLARGTRLAFVPEGVRLPGARSGHGTTAQTELVELPTTAEQIQYLTRFVARTIMQFQAAVAALHQASQNVVNPLRLTSVEGFRDPDVRRQIIGQHSGYALVNGRLYRLTADGDNVQVRIIAPSAISPQLGAGGTGPAGNATPPLALPPAAPAPASTATPMLPPGALLQGSPNPASAPPAGPASPGTAPTTVVNPLALMESITGQKASEDGLEVTMAAAQFRLTPTGIEPMAPNAPGSDIWFVKEHEKRQSHSRDIGRQRLVQHHRGRPLPTARRGIQQNRRGRATDSRTNARLSQRFQECRFGRRRRRRTLSWRARGRRRYGRHCRHQ